MRRGISHFDPIPGWVEVLDLRDYFQGDRKQVKIRVFGCEMRD